MNDSDLIERVAALTVYGLPDDAIEKALALDVGELVASRATEIYKNAFAAKSIDEHQRGLELNDGWNKVEEKAIAKILQTLDWVMDPDVLLKAAALANKATRRSGNPTNSLIDAGSAGPVIVMQLNANFVNRLNGNLQINQAQLPPPVKRQADMPAPKLIEQMLTGAVARFDTKKRDSQTIDLVALEEHLLQQAG